MKRDFIIIAPTLALAQKWLREKHDISLESIVNSITEVQEEKYKIDSWQYRMCINGHYQYGAGLYSTYEEALEAGINKALEFI